VHGLEEVLNFVGVHRVGLDLQIASDGPAAGGKRLQFALGLRLAADVTDLVALYDVDSFWGDFPSRRRAREQRQRSEQRKQCCRELPAKCIMKLSSHRPNTIRVATMSLPTRRGLQVRFCNRA